MNKDNEDLENALLEAIWIMRWNKDKTAMSAVLSVEEAMEMVKNIQIELEKAGYVIVDKELVKNIPNDQMLGEEIRKLFSK